MITTHSGLPRQKLPDSQKTKKWAQQTLDAYIDMSRFNSSNESDEFIESLYKYYNGEIDDADYTHVTSPFDKKRRKLPSQLHNYNILKPTIDILLGEKSKRSHEFTVVNTNPDAISAKKEAKKKFYRNIAVNQYLQELASLGFDVENMEEVPKTEELEEIFEQSYTDIKSMLGQQAMNYQYTNLELKDKFIEGFKHFLISGVVVSYRGVNHNESEYEILNPLDVDGDKDESVEFYEDGDWAIVRKLSFPSSVIDYYYDELTPEEIDRLENPTGSFSSDFMSRSNVDTGFINNQNGHLRRDRAIEVIKCYWKARKKIGFVTYIDDFGMLQEEMVDEGYKADDGEIVQWEWINEVWEGHRIDGDIYVRCQVLETERRNIDNPSICKLPINGRRYSDTNSSPISLVMLGIPYQLSYNIYKWRLDLAIAKSKDVIAQFDINMIPKKWKPEDFLYWIESTGIAWVDYNKEDIKLNPQHQGVMDLTIKTIANYIELLNAIIQEWERISGVNAQRAGIIGQYEGKATSQQAIIQSSYVTEDMFRKYQRFEQRELQAVLDYSQYSFRNGKKAQYVTSDNMLGHVDIDGEEFMNSEFGIFVSNQTKDLEKLDMIKQMIQPMIQNGAPMSVVAKMIASENFSDILLKIEKAEKAAALQAEKIQEMEAQAAQEERDSQMEIEDREDARKIMDNETKIYVADSNNQTKLEIARITKNRDTSVI